MNYLRSATLVGAMALSVLGAKVMAEEVTLKALTFLPTQVNYTQSFMKFVDKVNAAGEGIVQIEIIGGPEVVPQREMGNALKTGVVDMWNGAPGLMLNLAPEGEALAASNIDVLEQRANGALDLLDEIMQEKANAKYLAHVDAYGGFHIYLTKEPTRGDDGSIRFDDLKIRTAPLFRDFVETLGATNIVQSAGEVYTSLERGVVDGTGWPIVGFEDWGWDKFVNYRVDPGFFQTDVSIFMNLDTWNALSPEAQALITEISLEHEVSSYEQFKQETIDGEAFQKEKGIEVINLEGVARENYLKTAYESPWARMEGREATRMDELREKFLK